MAEESAVNDDHAAVETDPSAEPTRKQSVKFNTAGESTSEDPLKDDHVGDTSASPTTEHRGSVSPNTDVDAAKVASQTANADVSSKGDQHSQDAKNSEGSARSHGSTGSSKGSSKGSTVDSQYKDSEEVGSVQDQDQKPASAEDASRASASAAAVTEYAVGEDGNIHINEKQKAAIRRLMHPEEEEDNAHLGFTKQGKPIKANPYYKYASRAKDGAEDTKPTWPPPVTEPHASRLTRRSRRDSAHLPKGPSLVLEKIKDEFCEWLASLGSRRNLTVSKERLEELFSLGLENNLVVRPPEVCMTRSGRGRRRPSSKPPQQTDATAAPGPARRKTEAGAVAFCRSPSLTYYPELREKWRQMGLSRRRPIWKSGQHQRAPQPPPRVRYGDWYIPIKKWTPLVAGRRLAPPETEEARQLRKRELANRKLNETLSRSHAMTALREYIHICQLQGNSAFPEATPKLVRDVDQLVAELAVGTRGSRGGGISVREPSSPMAGLMVKVLDKSRQRRRGSMMRRASHRPTVVLDRGPLLSKPPPMYHPVKTAPGHAAKRKRRKSTIPGKQ